MNRPVLRSALILCYLVIAMLSVWAAGSKGAWPYFVAFSLLGSAWLVLIWRFTPPSLKGVLVVAVVLRGVFLVLPPVLSDDAYRYVWDGMLLADGVNPFLHRPSDDALAGYHEEEIYEQLNSQDFYSVYPPVSQLIFGAGGLFYPFGWEVSYYVIKVLLSLLELGAVFLLARLVSCRALLLYAWNPLVLVETAGQAHTEAAMLFFLAICLWAYRRKKPQMTGASLAFAGWVKLYPFVFLPFLLRRTGLRGLLAGGLAALALWTPFYHPSFFTHFFDSLDLYVRYFEFNAGLYYSIKHLFLGYTGEDWSKILGPAFRRVFLIGLPLLYLLDVRRSWPLWKPFLFVAAFFLLCSTTIHPWYFLVILMLLSFKASPSWHWYWLGAMSLGTYLLYVDGPYWLFVHLGWWGWFVLLLIHYRREPFRWLQHVQRVRAGQKVRNLEELLDPRHRGPEVLDLGAGEGYVGAAMAKKWKARVTLGDVCDMNRTEMPHVVYDGKKLPFEDDYFDTTVLYFVLHHAEEAEQVLDEALRVTRNHVVIAESVYETLLERKVLTFLDKLANRVRSGGLMNAQEEFLHFRRVREWKALFASREATLVGEMMKGNRIHRQHFFVLRPANY